MGNNRRFYVFFFWMDNDASYRFLAVAMGAVMSYRTDDNGLLLVFVTDIVIETMSVVGVGEIGNSRGFYFNLLGMKRGDGGLGFCVCDVVLMLLFYFLSSVLLLALCLY